MSADINPEMNKEKRKTAFKREWIFNMKINVTLGYNNSSNVGTFFLFVCFFTLSIFYFSICNSYTYCTLRDFPIHTSLSDTPPLTFAGSHRARWFVHNWTYACVHLAYFIFYCTTVPALLLFLLHPLLRRHDKSGNKSGNNKTHQHL